MNTDSAVSLCVIHTGRPQLAGAAVSAMEPEHQAGCAPCAAATAVEATTPHSGAVVIHATPAAAFLDPPFYNAY